jgi:hypothetical protein
MAGERLQVTAVLEDLVTCTVNCRVPFGGKEADPGVRATEIGRVRVTVADRDFVGSATLVAVTVTVGEVGTVAGAV